MIKNIALIVIGIVIGIIISFSFAQEEAYTQGYAVGLGDCQFNIGSYNGTDID